MAIGDLVIDAYGISWTLDVYSTEPILYYNHPSFGMLMYQYVSAGGRPWQCNNVNTMTLVSHGSLPEGVLKQHICVKPRYDYSDSIADCGFTSADDRCNCADPCCPCIDGSIVIECGTLQRFTGRWCTGGRIGIADPAGPSREWCLTFYDFESTAHLLCTVIYCDGTSWLMDIYCDDDFVSTQTMALASKCPLRFTFSIPSLPCAVCGDCFTSPCCDPMPSGSLFADLSLTGCNCLESQTIELTNVGCVWSADFLAVCGGASISLECLSGAWIMTLTASYSGDPSTGSLVATATSVSCDPLILVFDFNSGDDPAWSGYCGGSVAISVQVTV